MVATPSDKIRNLRLDFDKFEAFCDHLIVICKDRTDLPCGVVGTYRILREPLP